MSEKKVVIYSLPTWPFCIRAKEFLSQKHITYQDINVAEDKAAAREMVEKTKQMGVPVIIIDDKDIVIGFNIARLNEILFPKTPDQQP